MLSVLVQDPSQVAEARRQTTAIAERFGLKNADAGRVALVATELASNLLKHASGGEMLAGTYEDNTGSGIEVLALDRGPGMHNVATCIADGYSTAGTAGRGIGAVVRQSNAFDIASWPGVGTAVLARFNATLPSGDPASSSAAWGAVSIAKPGEDVCGDGWSVANGTAERSLFVADGLGHGPEASEAAIEAVRLFNRFNGHQVGTLLDYIHGGLRATRGAAISVARFDEDARKVVYSGIGNIAGVLAVNGDLRRMVSMAGTAGYNARKIQTFDYPFNAGLVIMHSDGLQSSWTLEKYPGLATFHPSLIAGILYRDLSRRRDDSTCSWANGDRHDRTEGLAHRHRADRERGRRRHGAPARAPARRDARLRAAGPDADRHGGVRARPNAFGYAGGGRAEFMVDPTAAPQIFRVRIADKGKGIPNLQEILDGQYRSSSGMGLGLLGARRLMDHFRIESKAGKGTTVEIGQDLPLRAGPITATKVTDIVGALQKESSSDPLAARANRTAN